MPVSFNFNSHVFPSKCCNHLKGPPSDLHICLHPRTWPGALGSYRRTLPCPRQVLVAINIIITINREHQPNIMIKSMFRSRSLAAGFTTFCCFSTIFFANFSFLFLVKTIGRWGDLTIKIICFLYKYES